MGEDIKNKFLKAYEAYADALFRHCYYRVYDRELAKDLVQEAFCRTWDYLSRGNDINNLRAFLYQVLRNIIADEIRKKKHISLDQLIEEGFSPANETNPNVEQKLIAKDVVRTLNLLDEPYREVMQLRFIDDLSLKEISTVLQVSENTISVRIHRGIKKLRKLTGEKLE